MDHRVTKSWTQLKQLSVQAYTYHCFREKQTNKKEKISSIIWRVEDRKYTQVRKKINLNLPTEDAFHKYT